jgi:hypothetical protein
VPISPNVPVSPNVPILPKMPNIAEFFEINITNYFVDVMNEYRPIAINFFGACNSREKSAKDAGGMERNIYDS